MQLQLELIGDNEDEIIPFRYAISSYGADYPVDALVKRLRDEVIYVPEFQRKFVWTIEEASKFIESLILGLPVPGIFLSKEPGTGKQLIVDGQQRLLTLKSFYDGKFKKSDFRLTEVQKDLVGKTYNELDSQDRLRLDDSIIHAIVVKQEEPDDGNSSIYQIFERLNSTGRPLSPQEIRACIYYGKLNELLIELTTDHNWRLFLGPRTDERMKEEELILRFLALYYSYESYEKPLKGFLNKWMESNRNLENVKTDEIKDIFNQTMDLVYNQIGKSAFKLKTGLHTAIFDSVMVGLAKRICNPTKIEKKEVLAAHGKLLRDEMYLSLIDSGTSDEQNVKSRINLAIRAFSDV